MAQRTLKHEKKAKAMGEHHKSLRHEKKAKATAPHGTIRHHHKAIKEATRLHKEHSGKSKLAKAMMKHAVD